MKNPSSISHPLKNYTGTSQRTRIIQALDTNAAPIDGKTLAERLYLISEYARHINFYDYGKDQSSGEYQELDNWSWFFKSSLPFQLAILSKTSIDDLQTQFLLLSIELKKNPSRQSLESVLVFILNKFIEPTTELYKTIEKEKNSFTVPLLAIIKSSFVEPFKKFIPLHNASSVFLCTGKESFSKYMELPWQLGVDVVYDLDLCIKKVKKGKKEAYFIVANLLETIFYQLLSGMQDVVGATPDYIPESLLPLEESFQKKHQPHLALLFTFLELFKHLQDNGNELGKKHLDFFYKRVLKIIPKEAVPDKAHIVFEIAKHLEEYPLHKNLLLKDAKDINKQEIQFGLDHELILDKAEVKDLRSLVLYQVNDENRHYIEGAYITTMANSMDGKGKDFKKDQPKNWSTLGSKYSKNIQEGKSIADEHPKARLGFALASPVLLLQEGKRKVTLTLVCNLENTTDFTLTEIANKLNQLTVPGVSNPGTTLASRKIFYLTEKKLTECIKSLPSFEEISIGATSYLTNLLLESSPVKIYEEEVDDFFSVTDPVSCDRIFTNDDESRLKSCIQWIDEKLSPMFNIYFSGEKKWLEPIPENVSIDTSLIPEGLKFEIVIDLEPDFPAVVFYNEEVLKEKIDLKEIFPLVKIQLNHEFIINCQFTTTNDLCCLKKKKENLDDVNISSYHFLKGLTLTDSNIDVEVCGIKNLIVQNDENLQDVNKPIFPFGPRPKVGEDWFVDGGANFYIGSKEIFCKNWQKFWINTTWKNKPADLKKHYEFYTIPDFEDGSSEIENGSFRFKTSILEDARWKNDEKIKLSDPANPLPTDPPHPELLKLFESYNEATNSCVHIKDLATYCHGIERGFITDIDYIPKSMDQLPLEPLTVNSTKGFTKLTLAGVSFQHERFTYVLTRQMMALADLVNPETIIDALDELNEVKTLAVAVKNLIDDLLIQMNLVITRTNSLRNKIGVSIVNLANSILGGVNSAIADLPGNPFAAANHLVNTLGSINSIISDLGILSTPINSTKVLGRVNKILELLNIIKNIIEKPTDGLIDVVETLNTKIQNVIDQFNLTTAKNLPKEPYTPLIKSLVLDYEATADIDDIDIIHLYPYENTSKHEAINQNPTLFPFFDDEGTLFIGIENLTPGGSLSILFQLAEATADSEQDRAEVNWHYLSNNNWIILRPEFDIISDETDKLTVSGIVTIAVPEAISKKGNTVMPDTLYWIKVSAPLNVQAIAETIGIHTQAVKASARLSELNDKSRLNTALEAGKISKLVNGDFSVKKVGQPYDSFDGRKPEAEGHFYTRVSEHLKHKGRALIGNDYEKIVLEGFPSIYKVKCISHTMGLSANLYRRDLEVAPGYVVVTVIPDLTKLKAGNLLEPRVPVSILERIGDHIRKRTSSFARIKVMNPRFEYVNVSIEVRLYRGKSKNFYSQKLKEDITGFLAPWSLGDSEKLAFGQVVLFSDVVGFVEQLDYVDFIVDLELTGECEQTGAIINPLTARSILAGGKICVEIEDEECLQETKCVETNIIDKIPIVQ